MGKRASEIRLFIREGNMYRGGRGQSARTFWVAVGYKDHFRRFGSDPQMEESDMGPGQFSVGVPMAPLERAGAHCWSFG